MNIKLFKKLIKEAVTEAIYEELPDILNETLTKFNKKQLNESIEELHFNSNDVNTNSLPSDIRRQLAEKMGASFGFNQINKTSTLKVINETDPDTGKKKNPFEEFMKDSAANLTAQDLAGLRNLE